MTTEKLRLDDGMISAIENWFLYGWNPGSFGTALIVRDYEGCIYNAHELILVALRDHLLWVDNYLPWQAKDMDTWKGYHNMTDEEQSKVIFTQMMNQALLDKIK
tara:strand:- start:838 stop:1149 length:312 start_codon:yes stop_codon:yes gene_type:complete